MEKSNGTSLQVAENVGILKKLVNFIRKIFYQKNKNENKWKNDKNSFLKNIQFEEDPDKATLLKIQEDLEEKGINAENIYMLTKNLSEIQKNKLLDLYEEQIKVYEASIKNYKNNIMAIRKKVV